MTFFEYLTYYGFSALFLANLYVTLFAKIRRGHAFSDKFAMLFFVLSCVFSAILCLCLPFGLSEPTTVPVFLAVALVNTVSVLIQLMHLCSEREKGGTSC